MPVGQNSRMFFEGDAVRLTVVAALVFLLSGCFSVQVEPPPRYTPVVIPDSLFAEGGFDFDQVRAYVLSGRQGLQDAIAKLCDPSVQDYGLLCTLCEVLSAYQTLFSHSCADFSSEYSDIRSAFLCLLSGDNEERIKCAVTYAYYHPELCEDADLYVIAGFMNDRNSYISRFSRYVCYSRAKEELFPKADQRMEDVTDNEGVMDLVKEYWTRFSKLHMKSASPENGEEPVMELDGKEVTKSELGKAYRKRLEELKINQGQACSEAPVLDSSAPKHRSLP